MAKHSAVSLSGSPFQQVVVGVDAKDGIPVITKKSLWYFPSCAPIAFMVAAVFVQYLHFLKKKKWSVFREHEVWGKRLTASP